MKPIELLKDKEAVKAINELITGANKLKDAKKYLDKIDCEPGFLYEAYHKEFFEHMDNIDIKVHEAIEFINKTVAYIINNQLDKEIN